MPTDEQNVTWAGVENGDDKERLIRFWREASCGVNDSTGSAKLTSHAQWIICVTSSPIFLRIGPGSPKSGCERSDDRGITFSEDNAALSLRYSRASSSREIAVWSCRVRRRQYTFETFWRVII